MDGENRNILWFIAVVNVLTLVLLIVFVVMSWNVMTGKVSQQPPQMQGGQQPPQMQGNIDQECMNKCIQSGKQPMDCLPECGGQQSNRTI